LNDLDHEDWLRFEQLVLPHVDNACYLARWLLRSRADAEMSLRKPYFALAASSAAFTLEMRGPGCCISRAIRGTPGWKKIA